MHRQLVGMVVYTISLFGLTAPAYCAVQYSVTDLGAPGQVFNIKQLGVAAGAVYTVQGWRAATWGLGGPTELGTIVGNSFAHGLNDVGQVAGVAYAGAGNTSPHAVLWNHGVLQDLNGPGLPKLVAGMDVNNAGQVAVLGQYGTYIWQGGAVTSLPLTRVDRINNAGQVAGTVATGQIDYHGQAARHAALWDAGTVRDLGTLGGLDSQPWAINDFGLVAGQADTDYSLYPGVMDPAQRAVFWDATGIHDLGAGDESYAYSVNNLGQIVGMMQSPDPSHSHAFLYDAGLAKDLNELISTDSRWVLGAAWGINDNGQIVGLGTFQGSGQHVFLLNPVPDPTTVVLLVPALLCLWRRRIAVG